MAIKQTVKYTNIFQNLPKMGFLFENKPSGNPASYFINVFSFVLLKQLATRVSEVAAFSESCVFF
jgi:hypothetical protein